MYHVGERVEVLSPASGFVEWHKADGAEVRPDEEYLGVVEWIDEKGNKKSKGIRNPLFGKGAKGRLIIFPRRYPLVGIRDFLADIKITGLLYAGKVSGSSRA